MIKVTIHTILTLQEVIGQRETELDLPEGINLDGLLFHMVSVWGERLSERLFKAGSKELLPRIRIMVNGRDMQFVKGLDTVLQDGDTVHLFPPVSGG
ncbi:MAG: MoaD/ThiS family protein [Deltaproteobacteria bacterium]|nr:MoaD/ThiS family protein [Deltaproteobacteria bacterium]